MTLRVANNFVYIIGIGILRVTQYEKGWDYYSHEPIFWLKMVLFSVVGGISLFPTTKIIQRTVTIYNADNGSCSLHRYHSIFTYFIF